MLRLLSRRWHDVVTGVCLRAAGSLVVDAQTTRVRFVPLTEDEIRRYAGSGEPMDKAGGYAIQGLASKFIGRIEGCYFNVVGLPMAPVYRHLGAMAGEPALAELRRPLPSQVIHGRLCYDLGHRVTMPPSMETDAEYLLLRLAGPGRPVGNVGVLLRDPRAERLYWRVRTDWQNIADPDDAEILAEMSRHLREQAERMGAEQFLRHLEDTLSNVLRLSERRVIRVADFQEAADALYELHVVQAPTCEEGQR